MISDIGPGMEMLIEMLGKVEGDFHHEIPLPNGYRVSIIRTQPTIVKIPGYPAQPAGGSIGASGGYFEVALFNRADNFVGEPEGYMAPVDVARKLREWFALPAE